MTPKEKAKELVEKFNLPTGMMSDEIKQCALICVDEIIESSPSLPLLADSGVYGDDIALNAEYWKEVKKEIENL